MLSTAIPAKFPLPFAGNALPADIRTIPLASQILITPGAASLNDGFPPLNFLPVGAGGIPPFGQDMNGILNEITAWLQWQNAGGPVKYDASFSTAIGGYPKGAVLTTAVGGSWWVSTAENNTTNPDTGGAGWNLVSLGQTYAGNPNGNVAGISAANGSPASSLLWDSVDNILWVCSATGTTSTAVWVQATSAPISFWCGTSTGTGNAQVLTTPAGMLGISAGTSISWKVGVAQSNSGATTVQVGTFGTYAVDVNGVVGPRACTGGELVAGNTVVGLFDGTIIHLSAATAGVALHGSSSTAGDLAMFYDANGTLVNGPAPSSVTAKIAAVNPGAGLTIGHLAIFNDTSGTVTDGGLPGVANTLQYLNISNAGQTLGSGQYLVDTSGGAFTLYLPLTPTLGQSLLIADIAGTWLKNNLTIGNNGNTIMMQLSNLVCNVSGLELTIWYNGTTWELQ